VRSLGKYTLAMDTTAPTISIGKLLKANGWVHKNNSTFNNDSGSGIRAMMGIWMGTGFYLNMIIKQEEITIILVMVLWQKG
jgi:hypothetical protein